MVLLKVNFKSRARTSRYARVAPHVGGIASPSGQVTDGSRCPTNTMLECAIRTSLGRRAWIGCRRGEFHTFAYAGPMFHETISVHVGITLERDGFVFTDLDVGAQGR